MSLKIPPAVNYQSPLVSLPTIWAQEPVEGARMVPVEIDWGTMGGANNCVNINFYGNAAQTLSQIVALAIDNSACGADIQFIFSDTAQTYTIPAYSPATVIPVFTNMTQFFVVSPGAESEDITRFSIHNTMPPPIAVPTTREQEAAVFNDINAAATGTTQLVPTTVNGTLESLYVYGQFSDVAGIVVFVIEDGMSNVIAGGQAVSQAGSNTNANILAITDIDVRFQQGIKLIISSTALPNVSTFSVNLYYRTP